VSCLVLSTNLSSGLLQTEHLTNGDEWKVTGTQSFCDQGRNSGGAGVMLQPTAAESNRAN
jgi:hypothetical protein